VLYHALRSLLFPRMVLRRWSHRSLQGIWTIKGIRIGGIIGLGGFGPGSKKFCLGFMGGSLFSFI